MATLVQDFQAPSTTSGLIPAEGVVRRELRRQAAKFVHTLDPTTVRSRHLLELFALRLLTAAKQSPGYLAWMLHVLGNELQRPNVAAVPCAQRLVILPAGCAISDASGAANNCWVAKTRQMAQEQGAQVLIAESQPLLLQYGPGLPIGAVIAIAKLAQLDQLAEQLELLKIPAMLVPLLSDDPECTKVDEDWVREMMTLEQPEPPAERLLTYEHLLREANHMFAPDRLAQLIPRVRRGPSLAELNGHAAQELDPIAGTETIALDFLSRGGKHSRPFITLAVYNALTAGVGTTSKGADWVAQLSPAIKRVAMSIETFHKASLVHDDIQDDDQFRYGEPTLHRKYGTPTSINVGDYLIGLGYRLVSAEIKTLGPAIVADILDHLADAHLKLAEGQGAELLWRDSRNKQLTPQNALDIYALKTSPAFEAALFSGLRLAGDFPQYQAPLTQFATSLGVAFQILNDLGDWRGDDHNKLLAAGDVTGGRPTLLWALALAGLDGPDRSRLQQLVAGTVTSEVIEEIRELYTKAEVFEQADQLVEQYRQQAEAAVATIEPVAFRQLLQFLIQMVLQKMAAAMPAKSLVK